ncbi:MAG: ferrous iron transport protein B [Propionibacteriaceae bacterium]|nr:ferrous iron transport protein B [Propionibacteriaceae bacterium]
MATPTLALVGVANTGKTTLFNALTSANAAVGNWPGSTVAVSQGVWRVSQTTAFSEAAALPSVLNVLDLPGTYSLDSITPDEQLTRTLLLDTANSPEICVVVVDASRVSHGLYLLSQLREHRIKVMVALTMNDVAAKRNLDIDPIALLNALQVPVVVVDPRRRKGLETFAQAVCETLNAPVPTPRPLRSDASDVLAHDEDRFTWIAAAVKAASKNQDADQVSVSDRIDAWLLAPYIGQIIFLAVLWLVFQLTTSVAAPLQEGLSQLFSGPVSEGAAWALAALGVGESWVEGLIISGLITGVGMVLTFVPLLTLMFALLAILEDSGFLARATVIVDRMMRTIGLPGRAFLPLIVGFGCNVPGISATRILTNSKQRLLTVMLVPLTSCTARLTVFVMVGTVFFGQYAGTAVFLMYLVSVNLVVLFGYLFRQFLFANIPAEPLAIELPPYQLPKLRLTAAATWVRLSDFLKTAGGVIVAAVCAVWLLQSIPLSAESAFGEVAPKDSAYGAIARTLAPAFTPTGFGSWETTAALMVGFVAKEAVISSWAQTYAVPAASGETAAGALGEKIVAAFAESSGGHPGAAAFSFMIFLLIYSPCVATMAAQTREIGKKWTLISFVIYLLMAYTLAVVVFQVGRLLW